MSRFNCKLILVAGCCLAFGGVSSVTLRKREVSTKDADWDDDLGVGGNDEWLNSSKNSSNMTKGTDSIDDLIGGLGLGDGFKEGSLNKTKDTGLHSNSSNNSSSLIGSMKNTTATTNPKVSTDVTKNNKTNSTSSLSSDLDKENSFNWPKDQGLNRTSFVNATKSSNVPSTGANSTKTSNVPSTGANSTKTSNAPSTGANSTKTSNAPSTGANSTKTSNVPSTGANSTKISNVPSSGANSTKFGTNTTSESFKTNSTATDNSLGGILDKTPKNTATQSTSVPSSQNHIPAQNTTSQIPHQNASSAQIPHAATTAPPSPHTTETKYNGYWIPIFNFGNNLYFLTNKGYAQLVNFPAPIVYSFKPVSLRPHSKSTPVHGQPRQDEEFVATFFEDDSSFTECYTNMDMGNLFSNSYFGNWVAVFKFELGWHLQTYGGFVPLDMTSGDEAPVAYSFETVQYQFSSLQKFPTQTTSSTQQGTDYEGLATWSEPVIEN